MIYVFTRRLVVSLWLGVGTALALLLGSAGAGQCAADSNAPTQQTPDLAAMSIEDLMNVTVVTAGKKPTTISNTAAAVFVITREDIERYGYQTLAQALRRISGFYSETDRYIDFIGVRGYLPNGDLNRRVLVLIDGHKVNDYLYGQASVDQDLPVDMRDIERIEVVKGPGSALWGSEALLCVINCITKTASDRNGLEVRQDMGWRAGQYLAYGQRLPGGLEISGGVSDLKSDGQAQIYFPDFDKPETNNGVAVGLDGERVGRGNLNMSYKGLTFTYDHVKRTKDVPTAFWGCVFNTPGVDVTDERHYSEMSYENQTPYAKDGKLFCRVYQDRYDGVCNYASVYDPDPAIVYSRGVDVSRSWGAEARYSLNMSSRVSAILGLEYVRAETKRFSYDLDPYHLNTNLLGDYTLRSYYMQTDWDVTGSLRLVAGTRLDDHSIFGANWSPRAGLICKASPKSTLKLLYGKAFRAPSMSEAKTDDNPLNLHPERINTTELVWDQQMGENGRLVTSLFGYNMYDLVQYHSGLKNWGIVTSSGIETQYDYRLHNGNSGYFGISLLKAKSGDPSQTLASSPQCVATCGLCLSMFGNRAYLAPDLQYVSSSRTNMNNVAGAHAIANLTLSSHSLIKGADISLGITNLFNTPYYANAQPQNVQDVLPQGDRTLQFQFSYHM